MNDEVHSYFSVLPSEIVLNIFTFLPAKDLINCRRVCIRLKQIVDLLSRSDALWREYCKTDFPTIYKMARYKSKPGLSWYNIYRSLSLWPKLDSTREVWDEFASASNMDDEITGFQILRDGVIGVHKHSAIVYYNIETLERNKRLPILGDYLRYAENDDTIAILSFNLKLFIIRKIIQNPQLHSNVILLNIKMFILVDQQVYFVTLNEEIGVCNLEDLSSKAIARCEDSVMTLGVSNNQLHVLTFQRNIYTVHGSELVFDCELGPDCNLLHRLNEYNFLETLDWRIYNQWMYILNHNIPIAPLRDIIIVRLYGDIAFVGSNWGVLRIYKSSVSAGQFDLYNAEPIKQYNFMERLDVPVLSMCPILQIDVSEFVDGHTVVVAMPKKIAVVTFTHYFMMTTSVAMLEYKDVDSSTLKVDGSME